MRMYYPPGYQAPAEMPLMLRDRDARPRRLEATFTPQPDGKVIMEIQGVNVGGNAEAATLAADLAAELARRAYADTLTIPAEEANPPE